MIVDFVYLEIEGQSCLEDNVDRGLMKIDQSGRMMKKEPEITIFSLFFPHSGDT